MGYITRGIKKAEAGIQQLCCLGLDSETLIPAVLAELHHYVPSYANIFFWCNDDAEFVNMYDERPDASELLPLYFSEFYNRDELNVVVGWKQFVRKSIQAMDFDALLTVRRRNFLGHAFYNEFLRKLKFFWGLHMVVCEGDRRPGALVMHRGPDDKPFSQDEVRRLNRISSFIAHAAQASGRQRYPWVDSEDRGMIIATVDGKVEWLSQRARQLLFLVRNKAVTRDSLSARDGLLLPGPVRRICDRLGRIDADHGADQPPVWYTRNPWGRFCFRAHWLEPGLEGDGRVSITIDHQQPLPLRLFRRIRNLPLTGREVQVGMMMSQGASYSEISSALGISEHTAISHSRKIYQKADVHNRTELISKLLGQ